MVDARDETTYDWDHWTIGGVFNMNGGFRVLDKVKLGMVYMVQRSNPPPPPAMVMGQP